MRFEPTHKITTNEGEEILTHAYESDDEDGVYSLYTREEWESGTAADWTLSSDGLHFKGCSWHPNCDGATWQRVQ